MTSEAEPAAKMPRFAPKLLIVGGAAALVLLLLVGGLGWWLWPSAPVSPRAKTLVHKDAVPAVATASAAVSASSAAAAASEVAVAAASAPVAESPASAPLQTHDAGDVPPQPAQAQAAPPADEAPLDRLQRRLGQVLGARGEVNTALGGEWRVVTRAVPVSRTTQDAPQRQVPMPAAGHAAAAVHWTYEGRGGPQAWGHMKPEFHACANGQRQSPIDIRDGLSLELEPVLFDYHPSRFGVIDTGHTVQVNLAPGNSIDINGRRYELLQFHFHRPSEERINGRQFDMVVHLVHKDAEGRQAVVAVLLERGAAQPLLQAVWNNLPLEKGEEAKARSLIDLSELLPSERGYYTYMGSLTTPPCSEGVLWVVMKQPVQLSSAQIDIFSRLYPMNARPIQQASGRLIKQSQ